MIDIRGLNKYFNKGRQNEIHVVDNIDLTLPEKGMVAIFGASGCGKTTLLNVIGGLDRFASGSVSVHGENIRENTDDVRNRYIGYIFQNYNLNKEDSCFDNIATALRLCGVTDENEIEKRVIAALKNVDMEKYKGRTPDTLSGGQQQRIAIARAIVKNPPVILADEPTGNLDEANTVMIMDLLKSISKDHLVLLVTHEANLVDYYCDTVIKLSDGHIDEIRDNLEANGYEARDKNHIYLGELEKNSISDDKNSRVEYYGPAPKEPVKIRIVNNNGQMYVEIETKSARVLDETSEIRLVEGVYEEKTNKEAKEQNIDLSDLPPVNATKTGALFTVKSSIKSGYKANFKNNKKGKKLLRGCLFLFAVVIVFMTANFGTSINTIMNATDAYNHNTFYVPVSNPEVSKLLYESVGSGASAIDFITLMPGSPTMIADSEIGFRVGSFETFKAFDYENNFKTNAVYLSADMIKDAELVAGKKDNLSQEEIVISTQVADKLLEKASVGYVTEYEDLLGLISTNLSSDNKSCRIAGIVKKSEPVIYMDEFALARYYLRSFRASNAQPAEAYGVDVEPGQTVLVIKDQKEGTVNPVVGETIMIQGRPYVINDIVKVHLDYNSWLEANGITKIDEVEYLSEIVSREHPEAEPGADDYVKYIDEARNEHIFDYYEYLFSDIDAFYREYLKYEPSNFEIWLYVEKGVEIAKYAMLPTDYYKAVVYKEKYGRYPTFEELLNIYDSLPYVGNDLQPYYKDGYSQEFYSTAGAFGFSGQAYMLAKEDYISLSKQVGETHESAAKFSIDLYSYVDGQMSGSSVCAIVHSTNPSVTAKWLEIEVGTDDIVTPQIVFGAIIKQETKVIISNVISLCVVFVLMSLCMYFIMRSSLLSRIKEVGIYRAIGVSKKNLVFKFFVEAFVLASLTILIGYLFVSLFLAVCFRVSAVMTNIFFYPPWMALIVLVVLYAMSVVFGTLPVISLLRKTPSEILAKYDI